MSRRLLISGALLTAVALAGCEKISGLPVDYGAAASASEVSNALKAGVTGLDPSTTEIGATVQYTTIQYLAGGQIATLTGSTILSVVGREVVTNTDGPSTVLTVVEAKQVVSTQPGGQVEKSARQYRLVFSHASGFATYAVDDSTLADAGTHPAPLSLTPSLISKPLIPTSLISGSVPTTYHHLAFQSYEGAPPPTVIDNPKCRNVPNCSMKYHRISFDQVAWRSAGPEKFHFEFVVSPDVPQISGFNMSPLFPFYQGLMKSCVTMLVKVGEGHEKVLLTECQQVRDFLYSAD